jgi:hypothetical protein
VKWRQLAALLKIGYTGLRYWLIEMTPEQYHSAQSRTMNSWVLPVVRRITQHAIAEVRSELSRDVSAET